MFGRRPIIKGHVGITTDEHSTLGFYYVTFRFNRTVRQVGPQGDILKFNIYIYINTAYDCERLVHNAYVPKFENRDFYIEILFGAKTCVVVYGFAYLPGAGHTYYCRTTGTKDVTRGGGGEGETW